MNFRDKSEPQLNMVCISVQTVYSTIFIVFIHIIRGENGTTSKMRVCSEMNIPLCSTCGE